MNDLRNDLHTTATTNQTVEDLIEDYMKINSAASDQPSDLSLKIRGIGLTKSDVSIQNHS